MFKMNEGECDNGLGNKNMNIWIWVSFLLGCDKRKKKTFYSVFSEQNIHLKTNLV